MNKIIILLTLHSIFFFSHGSPKENPSKVNNNTKEIAFDKSELAKKWLVKSIENFFKQESAEMSSITTKTYNKYKSDATNVEMDTEGSLTVEQFNKKWKKTYDIKYAGVGNGFLISAQDWGKVTVPKCQLLTAKENVYIFQVIIKDVTYKGSYKREIKVIESGKSFLIDDVKEYN